MKKFIATHSFVNKEAQEICIGNKKCNEIDVKDIFYSILVLRQS